MKRLVSCPLILILLLMCQLGLADSCFDATQAFNTKLQSQTDINCTRIEGACVRVIQYQWTDLNCYSIAITKTQSYYMSCNQNNPSGIDLFVHCDEWYNWKNIERRE